MCIRDRGPHLEGHRLPRRDPRRRTLEDEPGAPLDVAERYVFGDDDLAGRLVRLRSGRRNTRVRSLDLAGRLADRQLDQLDEALLQTLVGQFVERGVQPFLELLVGNEGLDLGQSVAERRDERIAALLLADPRNDRGELLGTLELGLFELSLRGGD